MVRDRLEEEDGRGEGERVRGKGWCSEQQAEEAGGGGGSYLLLAL